MLWISTRAGCPSEGRLGRTWMRWPPGPKRAQRWGTVNFSGVAGRGGAKRKAWVRVVRHLKRLRSSGLISIWQSSDYFCCCLKQHYSQNAKTKDSAYVAREHSKCCLRCTQRGRGGSSSEKHQPGVGTAHTSIQQPRWKLWYHRLLTPGQAGFCIPGSARWEDNMTESTKKTKTQHDLTHNFKANNEELI